MAFWDDYLIIAYAVTDVAVIFWHRSLCKYLDPATYDRKGDNRNYGNWRHFLYFQCGWVLDIPSLPVPNARAERTFNACLPMAKALGRILGTLGAGIQR